MSIIYDNKLIMRIIPIKVRHGLRLHSAGNIAHHNSCYSHISWSVC